MLKPWMSPEAPVFRVIVAEEDECEDDQPGQGGEELAQTHAKSHKQCLNSLVMLYVRQQVWHMILTMGLILGCTHLLDQFHIGWPQLEGTTSC